MRITIPEGSTLCLAPDPCLPWMVPSGITYEAIPAWALRRYEAEATAADACRLELALAEAGLPAIHACAEHLDASAADLRRAERRVARLRLQRSVLVAGVVSLAAGLVIVAAVD